MQTAVEQSTPAAPHDTRRQKVIYWLVSAPVLLETAAGIQWDFARNPTVVQALGTLGFPDYFAEVLGVAKCLALAALLVPGFARLKEWAYAGLTFVYFGAAACHLLVGDTAGAILTPSSWVCWGWPPGPCIRRPGGIPAHCRVCRRRGCAPERREGVARA